MTLSNSVKGFTNRLVSSTSFGLIPLFSIPVMTAGMHLPSMMVYRFALGCLGILAVLLWKRTDMKISVRELGEVCLLALFYDTEAILMILGYNYMPSGVATTLVFSYPIWTQLLMLLFFHERFSWGTIGAMALAVAGVACMSNITGDANIQPIGVVIELAAGFSYALYMVSMPHMQVRHMSGLKLTFYVFLMGAVFFAIFSCFFFDGIETVKDSSMLINLALLGIVSTALSNVTLIPAIKQIGATLTAILGAFEPLTAMIISILVFGDALTPAICAGFVLIIAAVLALILLNRKANNDPTEKVRHEA